MSNIKALLFDKDGTLFDFATTWEAWAHGFLLRIMGDDAQRARQVGQSIGFDFDRRKFATDSIAIAGTQDDIATALHPHLSHMTRHGIIKVLNDEAETAPQCEAVPLVPLLTGFRARGLHLGVATNDAERPARAHLDQAGVTDLFDFIAGYDSGHGGKPAPGQLLAFAAHIGVDPAQVAMVGDSTHDLHAGRAAGMTCIAVLTGMATEAALAPFADVVLPDIGAVPEWLDTRQT